MIYGADNKPEDKNRLHQKGLRPPYNSVLEFRQERKRVDPNATRMDHDPCRNVAKIFAEAWDARAAGMGRCGEQVTVAFRYLVEEKKANGIALFQLSSNYRPKFNHSFVILGLDRKPPEFQAIGLAPCPAGLAHCPAGLAHCPAGWINAVWCDPWAHEWFQVRDGWKRRVRNIARMLPDHEEAMTAGLVIECIAYHDSSSPMNLDDGPGGRRTCRIM